MFDPALFKKRKEPAMDPTQGRLVRQQRKALVILTENVRQFLWHMDRTMEGPSTVERGKHIAALCNALALANNHVRYFTLGVDYRKDKAWKPKKIA